MTSAALPFALRPTWGAPANVRAFATTRRGGDVGVSAAPFDDFNLGAACGDEPAAVLANRAVLRERAALPSAPRWLQQVHGTQVQRFDGADALVDSLDPLAAFAVADAAVTRTPGVVLAILTADCLPVLFAARDGNEIGAAHAGWRGLAAGALEATVAAMDAASSDIVAWLGPAAGPLAYEIGAEVRDTFVTAEPSTTRHFIPTRPAHWRVDLAGIARDRLAAAGVRNVSGGEHCTISDPGRFFSHRRDGRSGRMASLVWMQP